MILKKFLPAALLLAGGFCVLPALADPAAEPLTHAEGFVPVDPALVEESVRDVFESWNSPALEQWVASAFPRRDRMLNAVAGRAPVSGRLRVLSVGGVDTLSQAREDGALVSRVKVTVRAQLEWEDPRNGFQRQVGTADYVLRIVRQVPRP